MKTKNIYRGIDLLDKSIRAQAIKNRRLLSNEDKNKPQAWLNKLFGIKIKRK